MGKAGFAIGLVALICTFFSVISLFIYIESTLSSQDFMDTTRPSGAVLVLVNAVAWYVVLFGALVVIPVEIGLALWLVAKLALKTEIEVIDGDGDDSGDGL